MDKVGIKLVVDVSENNWRLMFAIFICPENKALVEKRTGFYDEREEGDWAVFLVENSFVIQLITEDEFDERFKFVR